MKSLYSGPLAAKLCKLISWGMLWYWGICLRILNDILSPEVNNHLNLLQSCFVIHLWHQRGLRPFDSRSRSHDTTQENEPRLRVWNFENHRMRLSWKIFFFFGRIKGMTACRVIFFWWTVHELISQGQERLSRKSFRGITATWSSPDFIIILAFESNSSDFLEFTFYCVWPQN